MPMKRRLGELNSAAAAAAVVLVLIALTALFLNRVQGMQRIGQPGVKLIQREVFDETGVIAATNAVYLPDDLAGYGFTNFPIGRIELDWLPKDTTFGRAGYRKTNGFQALISVVLMGADRTSIHKPEYCLVGQGHRIEKTEFTTIPIQKPHPYELPVVKMTTSQTVKLPDGQEIQQRGLYVFWFVTDQELASDHNKRMLRMAWQLVSTGVLQRWAYVSCFSVCQPGQEDATYSEMTELLALSVPRFQLATGPELKLAAAIK
jgi:hypothetical protein